MATKNDPKHEAAAARWRLVREKGQARFILTRGVLGWGVTTAALWCLLMALLTDKDMMRLLPVALVAFPLGGVLWGALMWRVAEKRFAHTGG